MSVYIVSYSSQLIISSIAGKLFGLPITTCALMFDKSAVFSLFKQNAPAVIYLPKFSFVSLFKFNTISTIFASLKH
ncbi:hypothetical protein CBW18_01865 [Pedobacter sp. AJM]|nr:hypothetical protein CBW18_01865 [Pedobacter sp. AJM]